MRVVGTAQWTYRCVYSNLFLFGPRVIPISHRIVISGKAHTHTQSRRKGSLPREKLFFSTTVYYLRCVVFDPVRKRLCVYVCNCGQCTNTAERFWMYARVSAFVNEYYTQYVLTCRLFFYRLSKVTTFLIDSYSPVSMDVVRQHTRKCMLYNVHTYI